MTFYNDNDPHVCLWLRNLIEAGHISSGVIDERPIQEIKAEDLAGYDRHHFFAGIGGWDYALSLAGCTAGNVWTASLPCQPFSVAGKGKGKDDERHLWPNFFSLVKFCRPGVIFGEQVASKAGLDWLDGIFSDLEDAGYACGAADLCAASVGAPHIRQRLFWVAHNERQRWERPQHRDGKEVGRAQQPASNAVAGRMADTSSATRKRRTRGLPPSQERERGERSVDGDCAKRSSDGGETGRLADDKRERRQRRKGTAQGRVNDGKTAERQEGNDGPVSIHEVGFDFWSDFDIIQCGDGKARRIESGIQPLVDGASFVLADGRTRENTSRTKILRGIGNSIVPAIAAAFVQAFMEAIS